MATSDNSHRASDLMLARVLATLLACAVGALGMLAIVTGSYHGYTSKQGGAEVFMDGTDARLMGAVHLVLGAFPLALWCRTGRAAAWWGGGCAVALAVLLVLLLWS